MREWSVRSTDSFGDVLAEIMRMKDLTPERLVGMDHSIVAETSKKKAAFFSDNIINLEKKQYEEIFRKANHGPPPVLSSPESAISLVVQSLPPDILIANLPALQEACKYSYLKRYLLKQMLSFIGLLRCIRDDVGHVQERLASRLKPDPQIDDIISALVHSQVPKAWKEMSRKNRLSLSDWLKRVREQHEFFTNLLENSFLKPNVFNFKLLADPRGLLEAYHLDCTNQRAPNMRFGEIVMTFKLTTVFERNSAGLPLDGIYLLGLKFKQGLLDRLRGDLLEKTDISTTDECPAIQVTGKYAKKVNDKQENRVFSCPVIDLNCQDDTSMAFQQPLFTLVKYHNHRKYRRARKSRHFQFAART